MNTEEQIEQLLGELPLREPSAALDGRVLAETAPPPSHRLMWLRAAGTISAMAAAVLVAVLTLQWFKPSDPAAPTAVPAPITQVTDGRLVEATLDKTELYDEGLVRLDRAGQPVHRMRQVTTKQTIIHDEQSNETWEIIEPQEEKYFCVLNPF